MDQEAGSFDDERFEDEMDNEEAIASYYSHI
jgi:hypothetical protein